MNITLSHFFYISNLLSLIRIFLVIPIVFYASQEGTEATNWMILVIVIAMLTDFLDGALSRKLNQVTDLGRILDPIADKLILGIGLVALCYFKGFPLLPVKLLIFRDVMILGGSYFFVRQKERAPEANFWGKLNTLLFALAVLAFLIQGLSKLTLFLIGCSVVTVYASGVFYYLLAEETLEMTTKQKWIGRITVLILMIPVILF